jgi:hypothetical protein
MNNYIYHYTDIDTLALILENRTIRFNRLDRVDDVSEGNAFEKIKLQEFFFVSCWTYDTQESIPQWHIYTNEMSGVRLRFPKKLFNWKKVVVPDSHKPFMHGKIYSPIPFDKIFTDDYFILPSFLNEDQFENIVEYDENFKLLKNEAIQIKVDNGQFKASIQHSGRIASLKAPDWKFQKEFRFVLMIFPSFPNQGLIDKNWQKNIPNFIAQALYNGNGSNLEYFDIEINKMAIDSLEVTVGPLCPPGKKLIVESLIDKYCGNGVVRDSNFKGTIRSPKR